MVQKIGGSSDTRKVIEMWELEIIIIIILLIGMNAGVVISLIKIKESSVIIFIAILVDTILVVLLLTYLNVGGFIYAYAPYKGIYNWTDITLECVELAAFLSIFFIAFIARAKYPVIGGKGWNILLLAIALGSIGMYFDIYGEFLNFTQEFFPTYKLITGMFQISGIIGLAIAFLALYKFSAILFPPEEVKGKSK